MSEILEEFEENIEQKNPRGYQFYIKILTLLLIVIGFGIYIGDMLFGNSSLDVLLDLQSEKQVLQQSIDNLKQENAILQKEYFELKDLDPEQ